MLNGSLEEKIFLEPDFFVFALFFFRIRGQRVLLGEQADVVFA